MSAYRQARHGRGGVPFRPVLTDGFDRADIASPGAGYYIGSQYSYAANGSDTNAQQRDCFHIVNGVLNIGRSGSSNSTIYTVYTPLTDLTFSDVFLQGDFANLAANRQYTYLWLANKGSIDSYTAGGPNGVGLALLGGNAVLNFNTNNAQTQTSYSVATTGTSLRAWRGLNGLWNIAAYENGQWVTKMANITPPADLPTFGYFAVSFYQQQSRIPFVDNIVYGKAGV